MMLTLIAVACSFVVSFTLFNVFTGFYKRHSECLPVDSIVFAASCAYLFWFLT